MKSPFASLTIWGVVVAVLPTVLGWLGLGISPSEAQTLVDQVRNVIEVAMTLAGTVMAIYGRWRATGPLRLS